MKRDLDLIRNILLDVECTEPGKAIDGFEYEGKSSAEILEHVQLLVEAGFIEALLRTDAKGFPNACTVRRLTWNGHEFIANARDQDLWQRVLKSCGSKVESISVSVLSQLLTRAVSSALGLP